MPQSNNLIARFIFNFFQKFVSRRIKRTGEHEVLPDHQTHFVAKIIEKILLIISATPNPDHIHVGVFGSLKQFASAFRRCRRRQCIGRNPIGPLAENFTSVHFKCKAGTRFIHVGNEFKFAQADLALLDLFTAAYFKIIEILFTLTCGPPEFWFSNVNFAFNPGPSII